MTNRDAIEMLKAYIKANESICIDMEFPNMYERQNQALEMGIQALEKQEPKKVLLWKQLDDIGDCPNCRGTTTREKSPKRCRFCGQAIDWSE